MKLLHYKLIGLERVVLGFLVCNTLFLLAVEC